MKNWILFLFVSGVAVSLTAQESAMTVPETQTVLVTKRTATWCSICGGYAWDMMKRLQTSYDSSQAVVVAAHHSSGSRLYSEAAEAWIDAFESSFSQPRFYVGTEVLGGGDSRTETAIEDRIAAENSTSPLAQAVLDIAYEPQSRGLRVRARMSFFQTGVTGDYRLGLYLVERSVMEEQSRQGSSVEHNNVLRESILANPFGKLIHQGEVQSGLTYDTEQFYALPAQYDIDNLLFLAVIWQEEGESLSYVNATATSRYEQMQTTSVADRQLPGTFGLLQNPLSEEIPVYMNLPEAEPALQWHLIGVDGKLIRQGNWSFLPAGEHSRSIPVSEMQSGHYFLRLLNGQGQQRTIPFIKQ